MAKSVSNWFQKAPTPLMGFIENINQLFGLIFWGRVLGLCIRAAAQKCAFLITSFRAHFPFEHKCTEKGYFWWKDFWSRELRSENFRFKNLISRKKWFQGTNLFSTELSGSRIKGHLRTFMGQRFSFKIKLLYYYIIIIILFIILFCIIYCIIYNYIIKDAEKKTIFIRLLILCLISENQI